MKSIQDIKGLVVAPFTAFKANGDLDLERVAAQAQYYKDNGIVGVFACGSTGEGPALTVEEKKALMAEWARCRDDRFAVIGFLGGTSVRECQDLALHAQRVGCDAVAMTAPYYHRPAGVHELALTLAEVASAVPELPFFYYHIPVLTRVEVPVFALLKELEALAPNFVGIKYSNPDATQFQLCLNYKGGKYKMMWGYDEMMLSVLALGADTFVGSTYGYNAPLYHEIMAAYAARDLEKAAALQLKAVELVQYLGKYGTGAGKAFMKAAGFDLGPCRRPWRTLTDAEYEAFLTDLQDSPFAAYKNVVR